MINLFIYLLPLSISFSINYLPHGNEGYWNEIQDKGHNIWVGWTQDSDINWCRTKSTLPFSIDKISLVIENLENYDRVFDRVKSSVLVDTNIVHITIDMPFPISDRDYIVRYKVEKQNSFYSYKFKAVEDTNIAIDENCIRLVNAAGEWYLKTTDSSSTEVSYTWNGELGGDFPDWALSRAWKKQGTEMIEWLRESLEEIYKD